MKGWTFFDVIVWFSFLFFIFSSQGACFCARILMSSLLKGDCFLALLPLFSHESTILTWELGHSLLVLVPGVSPHCFTPWRVPTVLVLPPLLLQFIQDQPSDHSWGAMIYNCPCKSFHLTGPICHFLPLLQSCLFFQCHGLLSNSENHWQAECWASVMSQNCDFSFSPTNHSELSLFSQFLDMKFKKYINSFVTHLRDSLTFYFHCFHFLPPSVGNQQSAF